MDVKKDYIIVEYDNITASAKVIGFVDSNDNNFYKVEGECSRCGQCCISRCNHLTSEEIDGKKVYSCSIYQLRPMLCGIFPGSVSDIITNPNCTYKLKKIE